MSNRITVKLFIDMCYVCHSKYILVNTNITISQLIKKNKIKKWRKLIKIYLYEEFKLINNIGSEDCNIF